VAVVTHGGSLGMIMASLLGMARRRPLPFRFGNASLTVAELGPRGWVLSCLNDTCHIDDHVG
jgi:broad specificity phosphatase PhoE